MTQVVIQGASPKGAQVGVSENGELFVRPVKYSVPAFANCTTVDVGVNLKKPVAGQQFVATGAIISGNRDIGVNGSIFQLYESSGSTSITIIGDPIIEVEVPKSTILPFILPNVITDEGRFINAKCDDNSVRIALYGYFVPKITT